MNPPGTLSQDSLDLKDIHLPDPVSWWPPAIGWWLLLLLLILGLVLLWLLVKKIRQPVLKKRAIAEMESVIQAYRDDRNKQQLMQQLSVVIRRIGISYLPRNRAAGVVGADWYERLNQLVEKDCLSQTSIQLLSVAPYQKSVDLKDEQVDELLLELQQWVKALATWSASCLNLNGPGHSCFYPCRYSYGRFFPPAQHQQQAALRVPFLEDFQILDPGSPRAMQKNLLLTVLLVCCLVVAGARYSASAVGWRTDRSARERQGFDACRGSVREYAGGRFSHQWTRG